MSRRLLITFIISFFFLWTSAWLLHQLFVITFGWWSTNQSVVEVAYWESMKALVWVVYPWIFWRKRLSVISVLDRSPGQAPAGIQSVRSDLDSGPPTGMTIRDFIGLSPTTMKRGYKWGSAATIVVVGASILSTFVIHKHFIGVDNWATYIYVITLTPIFEEIMFRGFILSGLLAIGMKGKMTNVVTTVLFVLIHCVGWSFQGVLMHNLASTAWLSIALVSLIAGFIRIHSGSLRASILLHMGNNAFAGLFG